MMTKVLAIGVTVSCMVAIACAAVEMYIITNKGYVAFQAADHWSVVSMQSKLPVAAAAFQIPNPADHGTDDSTNLIITLYDPESPRARSLFDAPVSENRSRAPRAEHVGSWTVYRQHARQGST